MDVETARRLAQLESRVVRQCRQQRLLALGWLGTIIGLAFLSPVSPGEGESAIPSSLTVSSVTTQSLQITDSAGRTRIRASANEGDWPTLELLDTKGRSRFLLRLVDDKYPDMEFLNTSQTGTLTMALDGAGNPSVNLRDPGTGAAISFHVDSGGTPQIVMDRGNVRSGVYIEVGPGGIPAIGLMDTDGKTRLRLDVGETGPGPSILFRDASKMKRMILGSADAKNLGPGAAAARSESSITLLDEKGTVIWSAP